MSKISEVLKITDTLEGLYLMEESSIEYTAEGLEVKHQQLQLSHLLIGLIVLIIVEAGVYLSVISKDTKSKKIKKK